MKYLKQLLFGVPHDELPNIAKGGYSTYPEKTDFNSTFINIYNQLR